MKMRKISLSILLLGPAALASAQSWPSNEGGLTRSGSSSSVSGTPQSETVNSTTTGGMRASDCDTLQSGRNASGGITSGNQAGDCAPQGSSGASGGNEASGAGTQSGSTLNYGGTPAGAPGSYGTGTYGGVNSSGGPASGGAASGVGGSITTSTIGIGPSTTTALSTTSTTFR